MCNILDIGIYKMEEEMQLKSLEWSFLKEKHFSKIVYLSGRLLAITEYILLPERGFLGFSFCFYWQMIVLVNRARRKYI